MTHRIDAVYENGVFRPVKAVTLTEGTRVKVEYDSSVPLPDPQELARALDEIAALPCEGPDDGFSGAEADRLLYAGGDHVIRS